MTDQEFDDLMQSDGWSRQQRALWRSIIPVCDPDTFRREMSRPDGIIEYVHRQTGDLRRLFWKRMFPFQHSSDPEITQG
jgi:hypothetical protein